jgi:transcriptional regulator with XRE-family HTH domain
VSFGQHLRGLRDEAGLSRAELARRAGVPVSTLQNWENDRGFSNLAAGVRLAGALGVPVERFAEGVEDPAEDEPEPDGERPRRARNRAHRVGRGVARGGPRRAPGVTSGG